jgi:1-phosphatidylinositol phosphodiesterase
MLPSHPGSLRLARIGLLLVIVGAGALACSSSTPPGAGDGGSPSADGGAQDSGVNPMDAAPTDSSLPPDATVDATAPTDAGSPDASVSDSGSSDSSVADSGTDSGVVLADGAVVSPSSWMSAIPGSTSLADLSIPGTHDTGATVPNSEAAVTQCQDLTIAEQLAIGVRYFDIRVKNLNNAFEVYHLDTDQNLTFASVLESISAFFTANPSETLVMCVKEETPDPQTGSTNTFEQTFDSYVSPAPALWYLQPSIPLLDQARGKVVLLRRFSATNLPAGIDASSGWADNTTFTLSTGSATLQIQDYYQISTNASKWAAITGLFAQAVAEDASTTSLYVNNTSAYFELDSGLEDITDVSNAINPMLVAYFMANTSGRSGIVGMDFVDAQKAQLVLSTNFQ